MPGFAALRVVSKNSRYQESFARIGDGRGSRCAQTAAQRGSCPGSAQDQTPSAPPAPASGQAAEVPPAPASGQVAELQERERVAKWHQDILLLEAENKHRTEVVRSEVRDDFLKKMAIEEIDDDAHRPSSAPPAAMVCCPRPALPPKNAVVNGTHRPSISRISPRCALTMSLMAHFTLLP